MFGPAIRIPREAARISVRRRSNGELRITYPRCGRLIAGLVTFVAGAGLWLFRLPADALHEPLEYALGLLMVSPGLWGIGRAMRPRSVLRISKGELVVHHGPAFFERAVTRLPLDTLEVQTLCQVEPMVCYNSHVFSRRLLSAFAPVSGSRPQKTEAPLHTLQVRNSGQGEWLSVLGSPVASEVENARLAITTAAQAGGVEVEVEAELDDSAEEIIP